MIYVQFKQRAKFGVLGFISGILNGLFGAGGGVIAVPLLEKFGVEAKKAHATSIAIILPTSIISAVLYYLNGNIDLLGSLAYLPTGLIGAGVGAVLLKKISVKWLKCVFAGVIIVGAVRMLLQ